MRKAVVHCARPMLTTPLNPTQTPPNLTPLGPKGSRINYWLLTVIHPRQLPPKSSQQDPRSFHRLSGSQQLIHDSSQVISYLKFLLITNFNIFYYLALLYYYSKSLFYYVNFHPGTVLPGDPIGCSSTWKHTENIRNQGTNSARGYFRIAIATRRMHHNTMRSRSFKSELIELQSK